MRRFAALAVCTALLALPATAFAESNSSTCNAYNQQICSVNNFHSSNGESSTLPFTGIDIPLLLAGGVTLFGIGLVVRRLSHRLN